MLIYGVLPAANTSILQVYREVWPVLSRQFQYENMFLKRDLTETAQPNRAEFHDITTH